VIDADVIFTPSSLRRMVRHFADPEIGAVTAYIKEGSRPANYMTRFIAFEYATAEAGGRRAMNTLRTHACLAGGAQLVWRASLEAIGGEIDTSTLAEDTVTTFRIQLQGQRVVFEPNAIVWAEEPRDVIGLWKQRLRWARGNLQVTGKFRDVWFRRGAGGRLGGASFGVIWFSITLMPLLLVSSTIGLVGLFFLARPLAARAFTTLWAGSLLAYLFITLSSLSLDLATARTVWREAFAFPGLVSLVIMVHTAWPALYPQTAGVVLFTYSWLTLSMVLAYGVKLLSARRRLRPLAGALVYIVGYGPLLCAIAGAAFLAELRGAELRWEKTEKTGLVGEPA